MEQGGRDWLRGVLLRTGDRDGGSIWNRFIITAMFSVVMVFIVYWIKTFLVWFWKTSKLNKAMVLLTSLLIFAISTVTEHRAAEQDRDRSFRAMGYYLECGSCSDEENEELQRRNHNKYRDANGDWHWTEKEK